MGDELTQYTGLVRNDHDRVYHRGSEYSTAQKVEFEDIYWGMVVTNRGKPPGIRSFARACQVGPIFAI